MSFIYKQDLSPELARNSSRLGRWVVNNDKVFFSKTEALVYCTETDTSDLRYEFENDVFDSIDWSQEPPEDLETLYRRRAEQLRDTYDYVLLAYSGGSDSTNMLRAFVDNRIYPDEVQSSVVAGNGFSENFNTNIEITENIDIIKDYVLANGIKYTQHNMYPLYEKLFDDPEWVYKYENFRASAVCKAVVASSDDQYRELVQQGKKCCIIEALEKPNLRLINNKFYSFFLDSQLSRRGNYQAMHNLDFDGLTFERFYVSGDMPELTIKQTHVMADYFRANQNKNLHDNLNFGFRENSHVDYKDLCIDVLYRKDVFDRRSRFSLNKPDSGVYGYRDEWLWALPDHDKRKQNLINGFKLASTKIAPKWFNKNNFIYDFVGCPSKMHYIKNLID